MNKLICKKESINFAPCGETYSTLAQDRKFSHWGKLDAQNTHRTENFLNGEKFDVQNNQKIFFFQIASVR